MIVVILLFLALFSVSSAEFQHDISDAITKNTSFHDFLNIFRTYQVMHNADTVLRDRNFCNRRFIMSVYACPQAVGNHMHEFLNGYAAAIVTNRTLLWKFCDRKPCKVDFESDCNEVLERFTWMPSFDQFRHSWKENNCTESPEVLPLISPGERHRADEIFMCCGIDQLDKFVVINVGTHEMQEMRGVSHPNALLLNSTKARIQTLFSFGADFLYGILFRTSFRFQPRLVKANDALLRNDLPHLVYSAINQHHHHQQPLQMQHHLKANHSKSNHPFIIGVHLRHSGTTADVEHIWDTYGISCVNDMLRALNHSRDMNLHRPCYILLASDRNQSLNYWRESSEIYCKIITSEHTKSHTEWTEHGPFTGEIAMMDLELVSRASDVLIGTGYDTNLLRNFGSTFSLLIAERRASSGLRNSLRHPARLIPKCVEPSGNRFLPKPMYLNPKFTCDRGEIPVVCPYIQR